MVQELLNQINRTTGDMLKIISGFSQEQFNAVPFEGSWAPAHVVEHVLKSESGIVHFWNGNSRAIDRDPCEKISAIESLMLDFESKMNAPEFVRPSAEAQDKQALMDAFEANRNEIARLAATIDLSLTFIDFSFPQMGEFTGREWIAFMVSHSKRHIKQLKHIYEYLNDKNPVDKYQIL